MKIVFVGSAIGAGSPTEQAVLWCDQAGAELVKEAGGQMIECWTFPKGSRRVISQLIAQANESRRPPAKAPAGADRPARRATRASKGKSKKAGT